jgi:hypothetical protein
MAGLTGPEAFLPTLDPGDGGLGWNGKATLVHAEGAGRFLMKGRI